MGLMEEPTLQESVPPAAPSGVTVEGKTTVVIPTYNEVENLPTMVAELLALDIDHLQIVIIDDNSPDSTGHVADRLASRYSEQIRVEQVRVIHRLQN